ncbi:MAG: peptidase S41, partial [Alcaligenaceae bacterium]|nr:peptidase S41 [Alcaligenaceae bacterium]
YPWLQRNSVEGTDVKARMRALRVLGVPYTDEQIEQAPARLKGKTEEDAMVAYLQGLGVAGREAAAKAVAEGSR